MTPKITRIQYNDDYIKGFRIVEGRECESFRIPITKVVQEGNDLNLIQGTPECFKDIVDLINYSLSHKWETLPDPTFNYPEED